MIGGNTESRVTSGYWVRRVSQLAVQTSTSLLESGRSSAARRILVPFEVKAVYCIKCMLPFGCLSVSTVVNKHKAKCLADYLKS